jgi:riboflavin kinase / FMN adenylyltransferase
MRVWNGIEDFKASTAGASLSQAVVTIGKFDGIHLGHQKLIARTVELAKSAGLQSVMITFDRHPDVVLNPGQLRLPLIGPSQKQQLIEAQGIENLLVLPFTTELAALTGEEFVQRILVNLLSAKTVVVGPDFRFGRGGACDTAELARLGQVHAFEVEHIDALEVEGHKVSTSAIREALDAGQIKLANAMLGRVHTTVGVVEHGLKIGRTIGFPTANISREAEGYLPLDGVYAGWLIADGVRHPAAHSVGVNETFQAVPRLVESHVIGTKELDLYDKVVTLEYVDFIRPAAKFNGVDDLVAEIHRDIAKICALLGV